MTMFATIKAEELVDEAELGLLGNGDDLGRLSLPSAFEDESSTSIVPVVPSSFDQKTADMDIAGLGDGATVLPIAGGVLGGDETEICHE
jgi:hypothetical protein